eukprot:4412241-Ditylum_brightwellii.AAC.1
MDVEVKTISVSARLNLCCCILPTMKLNVQEYKKTATMALVFLISMGFMKMLCLLPCRGSKTPLGLQLRVSPDVWT